MAQRPKIILGIESSCDETAAAVMQKTESKVQILSNIVASSASLQAKYGGVVPEQAAREQLKSIIPVINEALIQSNLYPPPSKNNFPSSTIYPPAIDAIAVTQGPGLIGSLLVGVEAAKTLALVWQKPLVPVNHLLGHFYANWIADQGGVPQFPLVGLLISGGHTDLILMKDHGKYEYLGGTRDDAAGECFDKCARLLGLPYPGGPAIAKAAEQGNPKAFNLPRPMIDSDNFDFSFSGLKTAVVNLVRAGGAEERSQASTAANEVSEDAPFGAEPSGPKPEIPERQDPRVSDLCASLEEAIADVLVKKTVKAAQIYKVEQIVVAGGVASNQKLGEKLITTVKSNLGDVQVFIPPPSLCTDNAAHIATAAFYNFKPTSPLKLQANPSLSLHNTLS